MKLSASHILVQNEFEAKDVLHKLKEGKHFEDLARDYSICSSAKHDGFLGEFPKGRMIQAFEMALEKLRPGEISSIVRTKFGYHIIRREKIL